MAAGTYLVLSCVAAALEGLWLGCQDVWGANPVRGYRLERRLRRLSDEIAHQSRALTEDEFYTSPMIETLHCEYDRTAIAFYRYKGLDPYGGAASLYWSGRERMKKRREELLHPKPPVSVEQLADDLYARLHPIALQARAVASAHRPAIGMSPRLALPPAN